MRGLTITQQVTLHLNADDWQLYTASRYDCGVAAAEINAAIETAVNQGLSEMQALTPILAVMRRHEDQGAMDSEPMGVLDDLMRAIYHPRRDY